ncbi:FtsX-like permease family protein [Corynebacterium mendelii]|uniref:ABC transporter permease n=1 Tax=Corynebacterium mendelii TaxID=2765362 RepID=A0A939E222_9CORY|nr:ABC transporter permease [Corynebacterium mendelii]
MRYLSLLFAIVAAVALTVATAAITQSLKQSVSDVFAVTYPDDSVVVGVRGTPEQFPDPVGTVTTVPGVLSAVFDRTTPAYLSNGGSAYRPVIAQSITDGPLQWRDITKGRLPAAPGEVATTGDEPVGSQVKVKAPGMEDDDPVTVVGHIQPSGVEQFSGTEVVAAVPGVLARWDTGGYSGEIRIAVDSSSSAQDVARSIAESIDPSLASTVITGSERSTSLADRYLSKRDRYFVLLAVFVLVVAATALLVIFSAFSVVTGSRRREFALLRSVGASAPQLVSAVVCEAIVLAGLGALIGMPVGIWLSGTAVRHASALGVDVPLTLSAIPSDVLVVVAVAAAAVTCAAAVVPAVMAARQPIVDSLAAHEAGGTSTLVGGAMLAAGGLVTATGLWLTTAAGDFHGSRGVAAVVGAAVVLVFGLCVVAAVLVPVIVSACGRLFARTPFVGLHLSASFVGRQIQRSAALAAIVFAGAALISAVVYGQEVVCDHLRASAEVKGDTDITVSGVDEPLSGEFIDRLRTAPGVTGVVAPPVATITGPDGLQTNALALPEEETARFIRGGQGVGPQPGQLVLGLASPLRQYLKDDSTAEVTFFEHQKLNVSVVWQPVTVDLVSPELFDRARAGQLERNNIPAAAAPPVPTPVALIATDLSATSDASNPTVDAVTTLAANSEQRISVSERFSARNQVAQSADRLVTMAILMTLVALIIAATGIFNTVFLSVRERARDRRLLSSLGVTATGLNSITAGETLFLAAPSAVLGAVAGTVTGLWAARSITGSPDPWGWPDQVGMIVYVIAATTATACLAAAFALVTQRKSAATN